MKRYDIVIPKKDQRDPNKTYWRNVGSLVKFEETQEKPEGFIIELHMFPETTFKVFEKKPKNPDAAQAAKDADAAWDDALPSAPTPPKQDDINPDEIPF